ncbi:MAG: (Fe-S)-binding protein [Deltaproteobacteria bacterium]|nr:(Fe-S)-binding protein [Deltaproteobacteria bacterium]MBW2043149.1 (Fe-S)-binding protein [Deltaproteobacteria bacterium]
MKVTLFIQCLVDAVLPHIAEAMVIVLERLGVSLDCPSDQTCCGQPAFNAGYRREARIAAQRFLDVFDDAELIVSPSGSCVHMVRHHYPDLFREDPGRRRRAEQIASRTWELTEFLVDVLKVEDLGARFDGRVTYHDSCHLLRGLGVREQPRRLLRRVAGAEFVEMKNSDYCCGFGGVFAVKYPDISGALVKDKVDHILDSGARVVVSGDTGCLLNIAGALHRRRIPVKAMHMAEFLAQR